MTNRKIASEAALYIRPSVRVSSPCAWSGACNWRGVLGSDPFPMDTSTYRNIHIESQLEQCACFPCSGMLSTPLFPRVFVWKENAIYFMIDNCLKAYWLQTSRFWSNAVDGIVQTTTGHQVTIQDLIMFYNRLPSDVKRTYSPTFNCYSNVKTRIARFF